MSHRLSRRSRPILLLLVALTVTRAPALHAAQNEAGEEEKATRISLGTVAGAAKSQVMVPVFLTPYPPGASIGGITATIEYSGRGITFVRAEKSFLLDGVNGLARATHVPAPGEADKSSIHLEVVTQGEPRKPLREGLIVTLLFRIEPDAAATTAPLQVTETSATDTDTPPRPIKPLASRNGSIEILAPESVPYVGCFFFTH